MDAEIIEHFFYTKEHEWVNIDENTGTIGITDYAQSSLGDITFVELPEEGSDVEQFEQLPSGEKIQIPVNPRPWHMVLIKH